MVTSVRTESKLNWHPEIGVPPKDWIVDCEEVRISLGRTTGRKAHLEDSRVSGLINLNGRELLYGDLRRGKACCNEIGLLERRKRLRVELRLKLLEHASKAYCSAL